MASGKKVRSPVGKGGNPPPFSSAVEADSNLTQASPLAETARFTPSEALRGIISDVRKREGASVLRFASEAVRPERFRTGVLAVDLCLAGGFLYNRVSMLYGNKSGGKSTLALLAAAGAQRANPDKVVVYLDVEGTLDTQWAQTLGVDLERLVIVTHNIGETVLELAVALLSEDCTCLLIVDSLAAITPGRELEKGLGDSLVAEQARLIGRFVRVMNSTLIKAYNQGSRRALLHINQYRTNIGVMFGDNRVLPGGRALEYSTSHQLALTSKEHRAEKGDDAGLILYNEHGVQVTKDKTGGRMGTGRFKLIRDESAGYPVGHIDQTKTILANARQAGLYTGAGSHHTLTGIERRFTSHDEIGHYFQENPDIMLAYTDGILHYFRRKWRLE
jgi:recombination protein RecA